MSEKWLDSLLSLERCYCEWPGILKDKVCVGFEQTTGRNAKLCLDLPKQNIFVSPLM